MTCGCNDKCELPKALQINNPGEVTLFHRVDIPASQGDDTTYPPKNGLYRNVLLVYLANNHSYLYNSDGIPTRVDGPAGPGTAAGGETGQVLAKRSDADYDTTWVTQTSANDATLTISRNDTPVGTFTANASVDKTIDIEVPTKTSDLTNDGATGESTYAEATDIADIWEEIEEIEAASDVTDVVGTYAELEAYDTSKLKDNDIIKVLEDETQDDQITYYRWDTDTETFTLIGAIGPYYTKSEADTTFQGKLTAGSNISIDANNEISATDTTYSDFTGATSSVAGAHGLVPAPTTSDPDKFLKGDGTWGTPPGATYTGGTGIDITDNVVSVDNTIATVTDLGEKVDIASIDLTGQTTTLLALTKALGTNNIDYARWECRTDIGSANISDKPTGYNASFVCEAYCNRWTASNDYRYQLICWVKENTNPFVAYIANNSSSITWERLRPTVNDATLTITQNGSTLGTFTANASSNVTIDVPGGGSSYTAGVGIEIASDTIEVDDTVALIDDPTTSETPTPWVETSMVEDGAITPEKASFTTYSTNETVVGTWIDGKKIYSKTFEFPSITPTANNSVNVGAHGITNFLKALKIEVQYRLSWETSTYFTADRLAAAGMGFHATTTNLYIDCSGSTAWSGQFTVTLFYVKTTD